MRNLFQKMAFFDTILAILFQNWFVIVRCGMPVFVMGGAARLMTATFSKKAKTT